MIARGTRRLAHGMRSLWLPALGIALVSAPALRAEDEALPSAKQILEDFLAATGGRAAYEKHHNMVIEGSVEVPMAGMTAKLRSVAAAPNKMRLEIDMGPMGKQIQGCDGSVVWSIAPMQGARIAEGAERDLGLREATFASELLWEKLYSSVECTGTEDIAGRLCYKVVKTPASGPPLTDYYDKETKLLTRTDMTVPTPMGQTPVETYYADYKAVDGVTAAHQITQRIGAMEQKMTFVKIEFNVDLPADQFALPEEVKRLQEAGNAEEEKPDEKP